MTARYIDPSLRAAAEHFQAFESTKKRERSFIVLIVEKKRQKWAILSRELLQTVASNYRQFPWKWLNLQRCHSSQCHRSFMYEAAIGQFNLFEICMKSLYRLFLGGKEEVLWSSRQGVNYLTKGMLKMLITSKCLRHQLLSFLMSE